MDTVLALKPRKRKRSANYSPDMIERIATLCAQRQMTQEEACLRLGVSYKGFVSWMSRNRHNAKYTETFTRVRAARIDASIAVLEDAAAGTNGFRNRDWRPALEMLRITAPDRFGDRSGATNNTQVNIVMSEARAQEIMDKIVRPQLAGAAPKQIADAQVVDNVHGKENGSV